MSVAYDLDFAPPQRDRRALALVPSLDPAAPVGLPVRRTRPDHRPDHPQVALLRPLHDPAPLRLTRRGVAVLGVAAAVVGLAIVLLGALSARSAGAASSTAGPSVVTVHAGDTLWSIASGAAPGQDPRAEIATMDRLNRLHGEALVPGQRLRVR